MLVRDRSMEFNLRKVKIKWMLSVVTLQSPEKLMWGSIIADTPRLLTLKRK